MHNHLNESFDLYCEINCYDGCDVAVYIPSPAIEWFHGWTCFLYLMSHIKAQDPIKGMSQEVHGMSLIINHHFSEADRPCTADCEIQWTVEEHKWQR
jgi:hypothetical protein